MKIIESKSKVRQSRGKTVVAKVSTSSSTTAISSDVAKLKDMVRTLLLDKKNQSSALAPSLTHAQVKVVKPNCVTYGGSWTLPSNTITTHKEDLKGITTRSGVAYQGPTNPTPSKVVKQGTEEGLSLLKLTLTCMNLELADRSVSKPIDIANDVSVKGELTLRIENEAITYNLDQTSRYSANYNQMTANKIDVIDMSCEDYSQEVLGFSDVTASGNPTLYDDPIVSTTSPTLTLFGDSDFLLFEEADAFLGLEDDPNSLDFNPFYYDSEGDILLLKAILNSEPLPPLPNHEQYMPLFKKELKVCKAKTVESSVDEPPEVELKDLPPYLEYAFLKGDNKLPIIIAKELGDEEKSALIKALKYHKRAIAWKLSDIQEVEKLLDAGLIYPIFDSPWVSPVHCLPKNDGFIVVENEENDLIPTRLVIGWRVCIDYRKFNEATRKDHFPLPFRDQMLERLAGNEYYCFLDGFFGFFQIPIDPYYQEKTTFTCPYRTFAYRRMPFGLCNALGTFQGCMLEIFYDMVEKTMEVFMDDFSVFGNSFENCLSHLDKMLQREEYFVHFLQDCIKAFQMLKKKLTKAPILIASNWDLPFELMWDASDFAIGALWFADFANYQAAYKTPIRCTPYKLVYGKACHLPIELEHKAYWALKQANFDLAVTSDHRKVQLNELNELCDHAYENSLIYKEKTKRIHDFKIKNCIFNIGDRVFLFNSILTIFSGKLETHWSRPFTITKVFPYGTVELSQANGPNFKVNGHRVKHYFGGDVPQLVVPDLQTFPWTNECRDRVELETR
nr:reverse transcriptase domain-containing protein [Tanacetum cinerariifolium]